MRLALTGAAGMLAHDLLAAADRAGHLTLPLTHSQLEITDVDAVRRRFSRGSFDAVLNCAAYTDVDGAESDLEGAFAVNANGAGNLADVAAELQIPLLHISTDYVFDGTPPLDRLGWRRPYLESDAPCPLSVYGRSKLDGERRVLAASDRNVVVRTAWLFGVAGRNFVETMLRLAEERGAVQVVDDQVGCPTWSGHLAPALIGLLERDIRGLVHLAGSGSVSWYGFAKEIFRQAERECRIEAVPSERFKRPAPRPRWSVLESERSDLIPMPEWRDGLAGYLAARAGIIRV
jgi:dTDP-4-dehydrorhamnose reductase